MPLPIIPDVARVALKGSATTPPLNTVNVIHVQRSSSGVGWSGLADEIQTILTNSAVQEMWGGNVPNWGLNEFDLTPLDGTSATIVRTPPSADWPVGHTGGDAIPQACALVKLVSGLRGKSGRGRVYLGPIGESAQSAGTLAPAVQSDITAAWVAFANAIVATGDAAVVVASYRRRTANEALNIACEPMIATQRRRLKR